MTSLIIAKVISEEASKSRIDFEEMCQKTTEFVALEIFPLLGFSGESKKTPTLLP